MGSSAIFNGAYVKLLKDQLKLKDSARILTGTDDPTSVAKEGETGSIYLKQAVNTLVPAVYSALGNGIADGEILALEVFNNELYAGGTFTVAGGSVANYLAKFNGTSWVSVGSLNQKVRALKVYNNQLYIGGDFTSGSGVSGANYIVRYDGSSFSLVGSSSALNSWVQAFYIDGSELYIGGQFSNYVIKWNGTSLVSAGGGIGAPVYHFVRFNSQLYAGTTATNSLSRFNGSSWVDVSGLTSFGLTGGFAVYNNELYLSGFYLQATGVSGIQNILRYDGSVFNLVGPSGAINNTVLAMKVYNNELYIGGQFTDVAGISGSGNIIKWNGTSFNLISAAAALNDKVRSFLLDGTNFYIGGAFTSGGGVSGANRVFRFAAAYTVNAPAKIYTKTDNGTTTNWKELVDTFNNQTIGGDKTFTGNMSFTGTLGNTVIDVDSATNALRVTQRGTGNALLVEDSANPDSTPFVVDASGNTSIGADATVTGILKLGADARIIRGTDDPTSVAKEGETGSIYLKQALNTIVPEAISALGTGINSNTFEAVECIAVYNNEVYVGGSFTTANGAPANYLAKWNGTSWVSVGTVNNRVVALKVYNNELYLGGNFTNINGVTGASYLAKWNGTTFSTVGGGSNFFNTVVAFEVYNNELYIGGYFTGGGGVSGADFIVKYNGSTFSLVGPAYSLNSQVRALAVYGSDLYIGGNFTNTGGFICVYFVRWDGSAFSVPAGNANAFNGQVLALAAHSGKLYIGGGFTGNVGARLVSWNGTTYATLSGTNLNNEVNALISHSGSLYIGGNFSDAFGITGASDLVRYDGTSFYAVGAANAFNSTYGVLAFATNNSTLYIGGYFNNVNGAANTGKVVSYVPSYTISAPAKIYTKTDAGTTTNWKELVDTFNDQTIGGNKTFTGLVNSLTANQDRGLKMIEGGVWTYSSSSPSNQVTNLTGSTSTLFSMSPTGANNSAVGQSFTPSSAFIPSSLVVSLLRLNNPTGNVRIDIYNDNAGTPGSVIASSNEILASSIATSATDYTFTFSTPVLLSASTLYYFMLVPGAGYTSDSNNNIRTAGATSNVYAGGQVVYRQNNTGTWVSYAGDTRFNIIGYVQQLSFTATAYIQVPGLPNVRNTITTAQSPISIANGQAAYVNINRTGTASSNLTVSVANIDAIDATNGNLVIIARGTSDGVFVGTSTDKLAPGQSSTLESIGTILANVTTAALKVTQTGTGDAILVEDQVSDTTPFVVKADGNVGIGTSSPTTPLHVNGSIRFGTGGAYLTSSAGDNFQLFTGTNSPNPNFVIGMGNGSGAVDTSRAYLVGEGGSSPGRMTFVGATFGVGPNHPDVTTPPFRVTTAGTTIINVNSSSDALKITQAGTGNALLVEDQASDTTPFVVKADGNVGVGTTSPLEALHVTSNARVDGILKLGADARIIRGTDDPTSVAKDAESGSLYLRQSVNAVVPDTFTALATGFNNGVVNSLTVYNNELYAGGSFTVAGGSTANYLAKWNGTSWVSVGTFNGDVNCLIVFAGDLYIGGQFTDGGGVSGANYIVKWNGSAYSAVGSTSSFNSWIYAFGVYNNELYIGGDFTNGGGVSGANYIVKWNGSAYSNVEGGFRFNAAIFAFQTFGADLYIGGSFTSGGGIGAIRMVKWNGSAYSQVSSTNYPDSGAVYSLATYNNELYIGGSFTGITGGVSGAGYMAKWNGSAYSRVGPSNAFNGSVFSLATYNNLLYIGGGFTGNVGAYLVSWNGSAYSQVGSNLFALVKAFTTFGTDLHIGGQNQSKSNVVKFTPSYTISTPSGVYAKNDNGTTTNWKELGSGSVDKVAQAGHGFAVGDVLYLNGSTYTKANASTAATSEVVGVVSRVIDTGNFEVMLNGELTGLAASSYTENALPATGEAVFLSTTDGKLTITEPSTVGQVSLPIGVVSGSGTLYVFPKRGSTVGGVNARTQITLSNNTTGNIQSVSSYDAGEIAGWVYIDGTTDYRFYLQAQFAKGGDGVYDISYQTTGDTPPSGFSLAVTSAGMVQVTTPNIAGYVNAFINYAINAPAVGASFPLSVDSTLVNFSTIRAKDSTGLVFRENDATITGTVSDAGLWTFGNPGTVATIAGTRDHIIYGTNKNADSNGNLSILATNSMASDVGAQLTLGGQYNSSTNAAYAFGGIAGRKENGTSNNVAGYLSFLTSTSGGALTERMRINSAGNTSIGAVVDTSSRLRVTSLVTEHALNIGRPTEAYTLTNSAASLYSPSGTIMQLGTSDAITGTNGAILIDFVTRISSGEVTGAFMGALGGLSTNGPSNIVFGQRTGVSTWRETLRIGATSLVELKSAFAADSTNVGFMFRNAANNADIMFEAANGSAPSISGPLRISKLTANNRSINAAGTVNANGADYAEYMHKSGDFTINKGDICGINSEGKLTDKFSESVAFVVKSTDPSYVGNDKWFTEPKPVDEDGNQLHSDTKEHQDWLARMEEARKTVDRIAFCGQVPVNVLGASVGDFIVPQGDNDKIVGVAVSNPTLDQYMKAIGKVVSILEDGRAFIIVKIC